VHGEQHCLYLRTTLRQIIVLAAGRSVSTSNFWTKVHQIAYNQEVHLATATASALNAQGAIKSLVGFNGEVSAWIGARSYGDAIRQQADTIADSASETIDFIRTCIDKAPKAPGVPSGDSESLKRRAAQAFRDLDAPEEEGGDNDNAEEQEQE
jgi:hypothetical protein